MKVVGILGFQGCIEPHEAIFKKLGIPSLRVREKGDLQKIDRIILPGGESTTMLRFLDNSGLFEPLKEFVQVSPTWGICAGAILLSKEVLQPTQRSLEAINLRAYRNYYGSQLESFTKKITVKDLAQDLDVHFIRAPRLEKLVDAPEIEELSWAAESCVFYRYKKIWATAFHVELDGDTRLHESFLAT